MVEDCDAHEGRNDEELRDDDHKDKRQLDEHGRVVDAPAAAAALALLHRQHDGQQRPGHHVVERRAGKRHAAQLQLLQPLLSDDARQHGEGCDAHAGAHEEIEAELGDGNAAVHAVPVLVEMGRQRKGAQQEGHRHRHERDDGRCATRLLQLGHVNLQTTAAGIRPGVSCCVLLPVNQRTHPTTNMKTTTPSCAHTFR